MYIKNFLEWIKIKEKIDTQEKNEKNENDDKKEFVRKGEIRWAVLGVNIGREMDGKGDNFVRPVLIIHTIGDALALVVPLTSKNKETPGYLKIEWSNHTDSLCLHQVRIISTKRLLDRIAKISDKKFESIKEAIKKFYSL